MNSPTVEELDSIFADLTNLAKTKSNDTETQVAANVYGWTVDSHTKFNTFVSGAKGLPDVRPAKYEYIIHAEANLVSWAAKTGFALEDKIVICTLSPCHGCIRTMFQAGIREVYYKDRYRAHNTNMLDIKVTECPIGPYTRMLLTNYEEII
jgi:deoxycytidylate deaminase